MMCKKLFLLVLACALAFMLFACSCSHEMTENEAKEPTCTEVGWDAYEACSKCGHSTYKEIPALGHNMVNGVCDRCGEGSNGKALEFASNGDGTCYVKGIGEVTDSAIYIPKKSPNGAIVTGIGDYAFEDCTSLTSVTIPNSVTSIGSYAFYGCTSLTSITIPDSVTSMGSSAFNGCSSLESMALPFVGASKDGTSNTHFGYIFGASNYSYNDDYVPTSLKTVIITSATSIGSHAFEDCTSLTSVTIPNSVTSIDSYAFYRCYNLTSVTIGDCVTSIGYSAFEDCTSLTAVHISDIAKWCNISSSDSYANPLYYAKKLYLNGTLVTELTIPDSVTSIGSYAFYNCDSITSVTIGDSVASIGSDAFRYCYKLVEVINKSNLNIDRGYSSYGYVASYAIEVHTGEGKIVNYNDYLFYTYNGANYLLGYVGDDTELVLPDNYNGQNYEIYRYAFQNCTNLTSITIPSSVTSIGSYAFLDCYQLVEVINKSDLNIVAGSSDYGYVAKYAIEVHTGESKIVNVNDYLFYTYNSVNYLLGYVGDDTELVLPDNYNGQNYEIYDYAFRYCDSLTSITIPSSVTSIGYAAFEGCTSLTSVTIPDSVTGIGWYAFSGCTSLTSVTIGNAVTSIGYSAFEDCTRLTAVHISDVAKWCNISFENSYANPMYYADILYLDGELITELVIPNGVTTIPAYTFKNQSSLTSITIPSSVTSIGYAAFSGCTSLTSVTIPNSVTSIGDWAFSGCDSLRSITIGNGVTSIGDYAFSGCDSLIGITIPNSVTSIGDRPFSGCDSLRSITIGNGVTSIDDYAFYRCYNLTSVTIGDSVTSIGSSAFYNCNSLTSITIPNSVTSIDSYAFYRCYNLTSVTIGDCVTSIGYSAFEDCTSVKSVTIPNSVTSIGNYAFRGCDSLTSVIIGDCVTSIGYSAFDGCKNLISVTIGDSVDSIGKDAFHNCLKLVEVINKSSLYIYRGSYDYGNVALYAKEVHTGESKIVNYNDYLFYTYNGVNYLIGYVGDDTELVLPDNYSGQSYDMYIYAFYNCDSLTSITIGDSVTSIGGCAFYNCDSLTNITIGDSVTSIGSSAFRGCTSLTSVTIPDSVTSIDGEVFRGCTSLASVTIGNSVTKIDSFAFYKCTSLTSITIPGSVTRIDTEAFRDCTSLKSITIPNSVTWIGASAFWGCTNLTIYCEATEEPSSWNDYWNSYSRIVIWGYKGE